MAVKSYYQNAVEVHSCSEQCYSAVKQEKAKTNQW